jgi:8-oxo-dGTP diphosphatase
MKVVTAAIIQEHGRFLIARRARTEKLAGLWKFPGGKVEPYETLQKCLEREVKEELGVEATVGDVFMESRYKYEHGEILLVALHTKIQSRDIKLVVHDKSAWLAPEHILSLPLSPADIPIAKFLRESQYDL